MRCFFANCFVDLFQSACLKRLTTCCTCSSYALLAKMGDIRTIFDIHVCSTEASKMRRQHRKTTKCREKEICRITKFARNHKFGKNLEPVAVTGFIGCYISFIK